MLFNERYTSTLITGANGFLGRYLRAAYTGRRLVTLGLSGCDFNVDLSQVVPKFNGPFLKVIHAAGLAHVLPRSRESAQKFYDVNVTGTYNLFKGLEGLAKLPEIIIFISTVAVYGLDKGENIDESTSLNGNTPYALSKIRAEELLREWGKKNNVSILILRLPLIAGTNPPGNLGAMIRAIRRGYYLRIGDGCARKSIVLAEDVARFIASCPNISGTFNLTDGYHPSVREIETAIGSALHKKIRHIPFPILRMAARLGDIFPPSPLNSMKLNKLTSSLTFSDTRARSEIGWQSRPVIEYLESLLKE